MNNSILLIENEEIAKYYIELVEKSIAGVEIKWVQNRSAAINEIKEKDYKVVIYDQRLDNNELGTEVMLELKRINPWIVGLMLSAYATPNDTTRASKEGIMYEYLNKNDINMLPTKIVDCLCHYNINRALENKYKKEYLGKIRKRHSLFRTFKIYILSKVLIDDNCVFDEDWKDLYIINAGEEQCHKRTIEISHKIKVTHEIKEDSGFSTNFNAIEDLLSVNFNETAHTYNMNESEDNINDVDEIVRTYKMPQIPQSVDEDYLTTTIFQVGQIFKKYDIIILQECSTCKESRYYHFNVYEPTEQKKFRKVNTYRKGYQEIIEVSPR